MSKNRILSLVLALVMVLGAFGTVFADTVSPAKTQEEAAAFLKDKGVLAGNAAGDLMLEQELRRRDSVILFSKLLNEFDVAKEFAGEPTYTDIKKEDGSFKDPAYVPFLKWAEENEHYVGKPNGEFGWDANLTAQEYSVVLLKSLGYTVNGEGSDVKWEEATKKAADLGVFKGFEKVEETKGLLRGEMAAMTFNALGVVVKGSDKTLAETLGIEMPAPDKVEIESVKAVNLREIEVKLNTVKGLNLEDLTNAANYRTDAGKVKEVSVHGDTVVLLLEDNVSMTQNGKYELTIRDVKGIEVERTAFVAYDNTSPTVEDVVVLGSMGIRVRMSEPIKNAHERDFLLNGKKFVSTVVTNGRDLTIIPYPSFKEFDLGKQDLTINALEDFAGYKSPEYTKEIDIQKDATKPEVENIQVKNNSVIVTFKEEVYPASVNTKNIGWTQYGYAKVTEADSVAILSGKRVEYKFNSNKQLPKPVVDITLSGVKNYSNVAMDKYTANVAVDLDFARPEIVSWALIDDLDTTQARVRLVFNKDLNKATVEDVRNYTLYEAKDLYQDEIKLDADGKKVVVKNGVLEARLEEGTRDVVIVTFASNKVKMGQNYILLTENLRDNTTLNNIMIPKNISFTDGIGKGLEVISATTNNNNTLVTLVFNKQLNEQFAERLENYRLTTDTVGFETGNNVRKEFTLEEISRNAAVELYGNGYKLDIKLPANSRTLTGVRVSSSVRSLDGDRFNYSFNNDNWVPLNTIGVRINAAKVLDGNKKLELGFNLPLVRLAHNAKDFVTVKDENNENIPVTNVTLNSNGKLTVTLSQVLNAGSHTVTVVNGLGFSEYGMPVVKGSVTTKANHENAPVIKEVKMDVKAVDGVGGVGSETQEVVVEVKFDQPMKYTETVKDGARIVETSMKNLAVRNIDSNHKHYFNEAVLSYDGFKITATFTGEAARQLANARDMNYEIVVNGNQVQATNNKYVAAGSTNVALADIAIKDVVFTGNGGNLDITLKEAKNVIINGTYNNVTVNAPKAHVVNNATINGNITIESVSQTSFENRGTINGNIVVKMTDKFTLSVGTFAGKIVNATDGKITMVINDKEVSLEKGKEGKVEDLEEVVETELLTVTWNEEPVEIPNGGPIVIEYTEGMKMGAIEVKFNKEVEIGTLKLTNIPTMTIEKDIIEFLKTKEIYLTNVEGIITINSEREITQEHIEEFGSTITVTLVDEPSLTFTIELDLAK